MARRWRIRHKLLLGLATAIAILGMLLAGTLHGLWSYAVTMKAIDSKLKELDAVDELKTAVDKLVLSDDPEVQADKQIARFDECAVEVDKKLDGFEKVFRETLNRELPEVDGRFIADEIEAMREQLQAVHTSCRLPVDPGSTAPQRTDQIYEKKKLAIRKNVEPLRQTWKDLRGYIRKNLTVRVDKSKDHFTQTLILLIATSVLGVGLMISAMRFFYTWIFSPVRDLQQGVTRVADGDFDHRIQLNSGDEMEELAAAFNDMTGRLQELYKDMARQINDRSRQLVRSERLASVGFLAAGVAHEINNPLASIAFCSEALDARLGELEALLNRVGQGRKEFETFSKYLKMIQEEAFRCKSITERLLEFSRGGEKKRDRTDLAQLIRSVADVMLHHPNSKGKDIVFNSPGPVNAWVNVDEIKSVVLNLVANSLESMDEGGRLQVELSSRDGMAELTFSDTGCGMSQEVLENIFEPFFTRSRSGKGTGLGLTITHRIVNQHGGEIEASSPGTDQGSTFRVRIPLQPAADNRVTEKEESLGNAAA